MRALVWDGTDLHVDSTIEVRPPGPGEVAVDITMAGLCHSDLSPMEGRIPQPTPVVLGHEAVGTVTAAGPGAGMPAGQRVVLTVLRSCGECRHCRDGRPTVCPASGRPVAAPFSRDGEVVHQFVKLGAFAERIVVSREQVIAMPAEVPDPVAAMLGCATVTAFGAVEDRARLRAGESVLVTGAGGIGLNTVLAARAAGAERIVVVDRNPAKERIARTCGATDFLVPDDPSGIAPAVRELVPGGVDAAFECVGHTGLLGAAITSLAWGGRAVVLGLPPTGAALDLVVRDLFHDKSLLGCRMGSVDPHRKLPDLAGRVLRGELDLTPLVSAVVPLEGAARLVDDLRDGRIDRGFLRFGSTS
ncbi:alcohol dehydrogenase catalytic domain-containing protein [Actinomadura sp. WMMB 499]|uniref:alcohol dehydrogenase catalytic domain-containing protein n=1 Tax=Actinomadura sp. WMMB 499 TaxID=1219491 RepID=UPI0012464D8C|nr:alcohol dehydrogenase catalytic domain-containing protein [Actinomadura sp. WMMB 499]QFG21338.1 alcohol dehydrogenase catalytic domain-containing protein [Actinomadura sp. WMMB 499]